MKNNRLSYPNLEKLLVKSKIKNKKYFGYEDEIRFFLTGIQKQSSALPLASLMAGVDFGEKIVKDVFRADPVHLKADRHRVYLFDCSSLEIRKDEAAEIVSILNNFFKVDSIQFFVGKNPNRWYVKGIEPLLSDLPSPSMLAGLPLEISINEMFPNNRLKTITAEIQMILSDLPLNQSRAKKGKLPINSLWFWGGGHWKPMFHTNSVVISDCEILTACGQSEEVEFIDFKTIDQKKMSFEKYPGNLYVGFDNTRNNKNMVRRLVFLDSLLKSHESQNPISVQIISTSKIFELNYFTKFKFWKLSSARREALLHID